MTGSKGMPKDLQVMSNILKEFGITEYESGVENHMLDFTNRYVSTLIEDAQLYSSHAKKKTIDVDDAKLAIELQQDKIFASPPSREITATLARQRNSLPLPTIRSSAGLRLPPDRHSLTGCNFQLRYPTKKPRAVHTISRVNVSNIAPNPAIPRPTFNVQKPSSVQCPIIKFSEGNRVSAPSSTLSPMPAVTSVPTTNSVPAQIMMPTVGVMNTDVKHSNGIKRKYEEDDDYDNN